VPAKRELGGMSADAPVVPVVPDPVVPVVPEDDGVGAGVGVGVGVGDGVGLGVGDGVAAGDAVGLGRELRAAGEPDGDGVAVLLRRPVPGDGPYGFALPLRPVPGWPL
jgi:hypothetical protein